MATLLTLVSFNDLGLAGANPVGGLILDANGDLFGTTLSSGVTGLGQYGTVFELVNNGTVSSPNYASTPTTLVSFNGANGDYPWAGLIADANGDLFGTTGGPYADGVVFELVNNGTVSSPNYASAPTTLVSFNGANGSNPFAGLIADANGDLFGTTEAGGANGDGVVFELINNGTVSSPNYASTPTTLVSFSGANGANPVAGLIADAHGDLFGTTANGGTFGDGTVFEIVKTASGYASTPTTLVNFDGSHGANPSAGLIADAHGDLFGTTANGGTFGDGTVFEIVKTASGYASTPTTLVNFDGSHGALPAGDLIADANGDLFGTTRIGGANNDGTVFEIVKTAGGYDSTPTTVVSFDGANGNQPYPNLSADANGDLFGTTDAGGTAAPPLGTIFEITGSGFVVTADPTVVADRTGVQVGATVTADAAHGVLSLDTDPIPGDTLHVSAVDGQANDVGNAVAGAFGSLTLDSDGSFSYTANANDVLPASGIAEDEFAYTASTGWGGTANSTLTVTVTANGFTFLGGTSGVTVTSPGGHSAVLDGGAGNDTLVATNGATTLIGGPGDTLTGGKGADNFVFVGNFGNDTITNYSASKDLIELDHNQFHSLTDVQHASQQVGSNVVITADAHDSITLHDVSLSALHFDANHFLLV